MNCEKIMDMVYGQRDGAPLGDASFFDRAQISLHLFLCPACAQKVERLDLCMDALREDFPPAAPGLEDAVMSAIAEEEGALDEAAVAAPGGFSLKGWVIAGLVLLVSLTTIFFGLEFNNVARGAGMSFMIPIGITIGIALTGYGALFIGSHLKKLSERFGL